MAVLGCTRSSPVQTPARDTHDAPLESSTVLPRYSNHLVVEPPAGDDQSPHASDVLLVTASTTRRYARLPEGGFTLEERPGVGLAEVPPASRTTLPAVVLHQEQIGDTIHTALQVGDHWLAVPWPYGTDRLLATEQGGCADSCVWSCEYEVRGGTMIVGCDWPKKVTDRNYIAVDWPTPAHPRTLHASTAGALSRDGRYLISTGREGYVMRTSDGVIELRSPLEHHPYMALRCGDDWYYRRSREDSWHGLQSNATFSGALACSANGEFLADDTGVFDAYTLRREPVRAK
jgi:hypothetical protein